MSYGTPSIGVWIGRRRVAERKAKRTKDGKK